MPDTLTIQDPFSLTRYVFKTLPFVLITFLDFFIDSDTLVPI